MTAPQLQHFYIPEEQSVYLLSQKDARKLRQWLRLCEKQLQKLGYRQVWLAGKGAYGFCFAATNDAGETHAFKFSRITLPLAVRQRLEEEAFMLSQLNHANIPRYLAWRQMKKQGILAMEYAPGMDLEQYELLQGPLSPQLLLNIAAQLADILRYLRGKGEPALARPVVHGDIKPSNLVLDPDTGKIALIDWGSSVFAQCDEEGNRLCHNVMDLMSADPLHTNARLGDVYFIGPEQLSGALSSPRFDEQGVAATLYALASGQSCRYGTKVITPQSLGLPKPFARMLAAMLSDDASWRRRGGDYFLDQMRYMARIVCPPLDEEEETPLIPAWVQHREGATVESVVYSSRTRFLRENQPDNNLLDVGDEQIDRYYRTFLHGMGDTEKAFLAAVGRLAKFPVVGGLAVHWQSQAIAIDSNFILFDRRYRRAFIRSVNNVVNLARGIYRQGTFKSCLFDARNTLHIERDSDNQPFIAPPGMQLAYEVTDYPQPRDATQVHSYFEDGKDPEEQLALPSSILKALAQLNTIHHTGCIIFEARPLHLKIHSYIRLFDGRRQGEFEALLRRILHAVRDIRGQGVAGFMKLPYKGRRQFSYLHTLPERYY